MNERLIPVNGTNPYANHPGFSASNCHLRITVTPCPSGSTSSHGFSCYVTGGHCKPSKDCDELRHDNPDFGQESEIEYYLKIRQYLR